MFVESSKAKDSIGSVVVSEGARRSVYNVNKQIENHPVNIDLVQRIEKELSTHHPHVNIFRIDFIFSTNEEYSWLYFKEDDRDKDFQKLLENK